MPLRNGDHGYGAVTKLLHWATVAVVVAQFVVGYTMDLDAGGEGFDRREDACEAQTDSEAAEAEEERCEEQVDRAEDAAKSEERPSALHIGLGVAIIGLGLLRVLWRATTPLPPWSERYGAFGRALQHWLEKAMLTLLFLVPASGLLLLRSDDLVGLHVAAHVCFYVVVGLHIALQLFHRQVGRML